MGPSYPAYPRWAQRGGVGEIVKDYDRMSKLTGAKFDEQFAKDMVADHKKDIREFEKESNKNDEAGKFAKEVLPTLRKHLDAAQSLLGSTKR